MDTRDQHLQMVLQSRILPMLQDASDVIKALKVGEKVPATTLADKIAERHNMKGPSFYPMLKLLIQDYPGVRVLRGAKGGIEKLWDVEPTNAVVPVPVVIESEENNEQSNKE